MATDPQAAGQAPRLNPFIFPSDTTFRFILLIVSVLGTSLFIYNWLYNTFPANQAHTISTVARCTQVSEATHPSDELARGLLFGDCYAEAVRPIALWMIAGVLLVLAVAAVIYWVYPMWKIRRDKLVPLSARDNPDLAEVTAYLAELCREAGVPPPTFMWNPLNTSRTGLAFGRLGKYYVALRGGLVTQFYTDRAAFRAVVLHELAHLRNADVNKTYFTVAVWQAFLVAALLPFVISIIVSFFINANPLNTIFDIGWRMVAITLLVYLIRTGVLRAREVYADVRASVWDGTSGGLRKVLENAPRPNIQPWQAMFAVHPDPGVRRAAIDETHRLFPMGFWDAFATGVATTVALPLVTMLFIFLFMGEDYSILAYVIASITLVPLAVGVVGVGVWRATFAALARGEAVRGMGMLGIGLGLGLILGQLLSLQSSLGTPGQSEAPNLSSFYAFHILWSVLLVGSLFFFFRWMAAGAIAWLEVASYSDSRRRAFVLGPVVAACVLAIWLAWLFLIRDLGLGLPKVLAEISFTPVDATIGIIAGIVENPLTYLALIGLWAFPLAARFGRKQSGDVPTSSWAFLDNSPQQLAMAGQAPLRPGTALKAGLLGGLILVALVIILRLAIHASVEQTVRNDYNFKLAFGLGVNLLAVLMQIVVAVIVTIRVTRLGGVHGLFAAFIAGCIIAVCNELLIITAPCAEAIAIASTSPCPNIPLPEVVWLSLSLFVNGGALFSLPIALLVSTLVGAIRRSELVR
jgi:Zn-dependent protease with chaperone function